MEGKPKHGKILTKEKPPGLVNVMSMEIRPQKGLAGETFFFSCITNIAASRVFLVINNQEKIEMSGVDRQWSTTKKILTHGKYYVKMVAENESQIEGLLRSSELVVSKLVKQYTKNTNETLTEITTGKIEKRFLDNANGTITDKLSGLLWLKQPKQIAISYEEAVDYCNNLIINGHGGWRLPTIEEWKNLVNKKAGNPALPQDHLFENVQTRIGYWSKTKHRFGNKYISQMKLWNGKIGYLNKEENAMVWPVRYLVRSGD